MTHRRLTYVLQAFSVLFMVAALAIGVVAAMAGDLLWTAVNCALFFINMGLFLWQRHIRSLLPW